MISILILHNIRSTYNVGAIFRSADAAGVSKIYLSGYTPSPLDQYGRPRKDIAKTALGAEKTVAWESVHSTVRLISKLKKGGIKIYALEQDKKSVDYKKAKPKKSCALILGEEVHGIPGSILKHCDEIIEIPMQGKLLRNREKNNIGKESLNVSVAAGIALFRLLGL